MMCFGCFGRLKEEPTELPTVVALDDLSRFRSQSASTRPRNDQSAKLQRPATVRDQDIDELEAESGNGEDGNPLKDNASAQSVRRLRGLIREKFAIDVEVWDNRDVQVAMRRQLMAKAARSDEIMKEILNMVGAWDSSHFSPEEWKLAQQIQECLLSTRRYESWEKWPPWKRDGFDD